ncbi:hypothetical protein CBL_09389 [Carabus blaptoides fortunei]
MEQQRGYKKQHFLYRKQHTHRDRDYGLTAKRTREPDRQTQHPTPFPAAFTLYLVYSLTLADEKNVPPKQRYFGASTQATWNTSAQIMLPRACTATLALVFSINVLTHAALTTAANVESNTVCCTTCIYIHSLCLYTARRYSVWVDVVLSL